MANELIEQCKVIAGKIYDELGAGFDECIYQRAFEVSLRCEGIKYENQRVVPVFYQGFHVGESKPDLVVYDGADSIVVELKATGMSLSPKELTQAKKYMTVLGINTGLVINFAQAGRKDVPDAPELVELSIDKR